METNTIFQRLAMVNRSVKAIPKDKTNVQQNFKYRGIDQVMNELHELFAEQGIFICPEVCDVETTERTGKSGNALFYVKTKMKYTFFCEDGSNVSSIVTGEAMDSGDKATNKAMSIALKYCLLQMFLIPTDDMRDPDGETHEVTPVQIKEQSYKEHQSAKENPTPPAHVDLDDKQWLTDVQAAAVVARIEKGELDAPQKAYVAFKVNKKHRALFDEALAKYDDDHAGNIPEQVEPLPF
jgi:hypothetical protein